MEEHILHTIAGGNTQTKHIQVVFHLLPLSKSLMLSLHLSHVLGVLTQNLFVTTSEHVFLKPVFCRDLLFHLSTGFNIALYLCIEHGGHIKNLLHSSPSVIAITPQ